MLFEPLFLSAELNLSVQEGFAKVSVKPERSKVIMFKQTLHAGHNVLKM